MNTVIDTFYNLAGEDFEILYRSDSKDFFFVYLYDQNGTPLGIPFPTKREAFEFAFLFISIWNENFSERF